MIRSAAVLVIGLTGGIGSGKSTVSALLAERGALVVDTDIVARQVVEPGGPAYDAVIGRFGSAIVDGDGSLNRPALAGIVFRDPSALADLNGIVHPAVRAVVEERLAAVAATDRVVILDVPLLVETASYVTDGVLVVDCPVDVAVGRLVAQRGMDEDDARRRAAAQATRDERLSRADFVIRNDGSRDDLRPQVDRAWQWIESLRATSPP